jgi:hypothetical protein
MDNVQNFDSYINIPSSQTYRSYLYYLSFIDVSFIKLVRFRNRQQNFLAATMIVGLTKPLREISTRKSFWRMKGGRRARLTTSPLIVSQLSIKCGSHDFSQPYRPERPVTRISLKKKQVKLSP